MREMTFWRIAGLAALAALSAGCAPAADTRSLTAAEKEQLVREQEAVAVRRQLEGRAPQRAGCSASTSASRLLARRNGYNGSDSFDSRGCPEESVGGGPVRDAKE
jgi:hypothetical protein